MSVSVEKVARIEPFKASYDEYFVTFDLTTWLGTDTISSASYKAYTDDGTDVSATIIDASSTNTTVLLKPYIKGGTSGTHYTVVCSVTTTAGDNVEFFITFLCYDPA